MYKRSLLTAMLCVRALGVRVPPEVWMHVVRVGEGVAFQVQVRRPAPDQLPPLPAQNVSARALVELARSLAKGA